MVPVPESEEEALDLLPEAIQTGFLNGKTLNSLEQVLTQVCKYLCYEYSFNPNPAYFIFFFFVKFCNY